MGHKYHIDESTAFAQSRRSAFDETTATVTRYQSDAASTNKDQIRDPPSMIVCQVTNYFEA